MRSHCHSVTLGQMWKDYLERTLKELSNALFRGALALFVPEICAEGTARRGCAKFSVPVTNKPLLALAESKNRFKTF